MISIIAVTLSPLNGFYLCNFKIKKCSQIYIELSEKMRVFVTISPINLTNLGKKNTPSLSVYYLFHLVTLTTNLSSENGRITSMKINMLMNLCCSPWTIQCCSEFQERKSFGAWSHTYHLSCKLIQLNLLV